MIAKTGAQPLSPFRSTWPRRLGNALADFFFPPRCVACRRLGAWLCDDCMHKIELIDPPTCRRCGAPLGHASSAVAAGPAVCERCRDMHPHFEGLSACAFHTGPLREAVHQLKYGDLRALAAPLGSLMARRWPVLAPADLRLDVIVPVPLHKSRERERGYNQAALLARELGLGLGYPVTEDVLVRGRATPPQVGLSAQERRANVHGAFSCRNDSLAGSRVLLVDDVCTTSSTIEAAAAALCDGGALSVWAYTLARAQ